MSHWCTYCDTLLALWKNGEIIEGQPWTLDKLNEHLKRLESGELNKRNAEERKGVSSEALFDFVDIDHYVMSTLHLMLGIGNYFYKIWWRKHRQLVKVIPWIMSRQKGYGSYQSTMRQQKD